MIFLFCSFWEDDYEEPSYKENDHNTTTEESRPSDDVPSQKGQLIRVRRRASSNHHRRRGYRTISRDNNHVEEEAGSGSNQPIKAEHPPRDIVTKKGGRMEETVNGENNDWLWLTSYSRIPVSIMRDMKKEVDVVMIVTRSGRKAVFAYRRFCPFYE